MKNLEKLIHKFGFENPTVIKFARILENSDKEYLDEYEDTLARLADTMAGLRGIE